MKGHIFSQRPNINIENGVITCLYKTKQRKSTQAMHSCDFQYSKSNYHATETINVTL